MTRGELPELGYIVPIATVPSILAHGILSHHRAVRVAHTSIASEEVQDRRSRVVVPGGQRLHDYANLYICPRNPMLYKRKDVHHDLCVLRVGVDVLDLPGAVVTDINAGSMYVRFAPAPDGLSIVNRAATFARYWNDEDYATYCRKKSLKCAEVLIPSVVPLTFVTGAYVSEHQGRDALAAAAPSVTSTVNADLFFL